MKYTAALLIAETGGVKLSGFPITVNPESTLYENTQAATNFGFVDIPVGLDEVNFLQTQHQIHVKQELHDRNLLQIEGTPVLVNPESTLYSNTQAATNFGFVDIPVGLDEVSFLMKQHEIHVQQELHDRNLHEQNLLQVESELMPMAAENKPGNLAVVERMRPFDVREFVQLDAEVMPVAPENKPGNLAVVERDVSFNPTDI